MKDCHLSTFRKENDEPDKNECRKIYIEENIIIAMQNDGAERLASSQWRRPPKFAREIERRKHIAIGARQEGKRPSR